MFDFDGWFWALRFARGCRYFIEMECIYLFRFFVYLFSEACLIFDKTKL